MNSKNNFFTDSPSVQSSRILYTPSPFARTSLLHLQETGTLRAVRQHASRRKNLHSYLCFIVIEGGGTLIYEGIEHKLEKDNIVFIDCRKAYTHSTDGNMLWSLQWCHFYGPSLPAVYAKYCERGGQPVIHASDPSQYRALLSDLYSLASSSDYIRDMRINEKLNALLTLLMESSWRQETQSHSTKRMELQYIKSYVDENYQKKITLESTASQFFIDKYYLSRLFKEQYGVTFITYLQQVRITHAKQMLRFTQKSIEEIGLECGVGELNYFSRVFKKLEGVSPSKYRSLW